MSRPVLPVYDPDKKRTKRPKRFDLDITLKTLKATRDRLVADRDALLVEMDRLQKEADRIAHLVRVADAEFR